ncbi:MAG: NHL repeat-containing protein [Ignavibacteria bacterium]|nr:NHL repeat-containing protein [Ignavibacteria bacterium]
MKKINIALINILLFCSSIYTQNFYIESEFILPSRVVAFDIDALENFYLLLEGENEIHKYDKNGKFLKRIGGFGWSEGLFDSPTSIEVTTIEVFVSDYNNNRIQKFDKDLNFIAQFSSKAIESKNFSLEFPISIALSSQGDLYVLTQKDKNVIKINGFSRVERVFGSYQTGNIYLSNPSKLKISPEQLIFILDEKELKVFDQFGNGTGVLELKVENVKDFAFWKNSILIITEDSLFALKDGIMIPLTLIERIDNKLLALKTIGEKIYLLTETKILEIKEVR